MEKFFQDLFDYNQHSNHLLWQLIISHREATSERSLLLYHHILNAHHVWNKRILGEKESYGVWEIHDAGDLEKINLENTAQSIEIINGVDLESYKNYKTTKGDEYNSKVRDILFHIINHSTQHRAQIGSDMKHNNVTPIPMDYIFFKR